MFEKQVLHALFFYCRGFTSEEAEEASFIAQDAASQVQKKLHALFAKKFGLSGLDSHRMAQKVANQYFDPSEEIDGPSTDAYAKRLASPPIVPPRGVPTGKKKNRKGAV